MWSAWPNGQGWLFLCPWARHPGVPTMDPFPALPWARASGMALGRSVRRCWRAAVRGASLLAVEGCDLARLVDGFGNLAHHPHLPFLSKLYFILIPYATYLLLKKQARFFRKHHYSLNFNYRIVI